MGNVEREGQGSADSMGMRLRSLRLERGITQRNLALRAGLSVSTVVKLERGAGLPHLGTVVYLAKALELSPDRLDQRFQRPKEALEWIKVPKKEINLEPQKRFREIRKL